MSVITGKDIYQDDGTLTKLRNEIRFISEEAKRIKIELANANTFTPDGKSKINTLTAEVNKLTEQYKARKITLEQLEAAIQKEVQATNEERIAKQALSNAVREANNIAKLTIQLNTSIEGSYKKIAAQYALNVIALDKMNTAEIKNMDAINKLTKETEELRKKMNAAKTAQGNYTLGVGDYTNSIIKALDKQKQLVAHLAKTEIEFKRLPASVRNTVQAQEYHKQVVESLKNQISELTNITGRNIEANQRSNSAFTNLWQSAKNLLAVYLSFSGLKSIGSAIFGQTKDLDSLNLAYEKTIPNATKLAQTNVFLQRLSEDYGIDILSLKEAYLKYNAAVQTSNLSSEQQRQIFESVTKATSVLGLSGDKVKLVFLAIEQMMSKGKISSEELRRQLGENLPGAMTIMAKALGVPVLEMDKMLKKGEIMSEDALPKFAKELEKAYGIENLTTINNLASAQGRYSTAVTELIQKLKASDVFKSFFNLLTSGINIIGNNIQSIFNLIKAITLIGIAYATWKTSLALTNILQKEGIATTLADITVKNLWTATTTLSKKATDALNASIKANPIGAIASLVLTAVSAYMMFNTQVDKSTKLMSDLEVATKHNLNTHKVELDNLLAVAKNEKNTLDERHKALTKINEISPEYLGNLTLEELKTNKAKIAIDNYLASLEVQIKYQAAKDKLLELENKRLEDVNTGNDRNVTFWQQTWNLVKAFGNGTTAMIYNNQTAIKNATKSEKEYLIQRQKLLDILAKPIFDTGGSGGSGGHGDGSGGGNKGDKDKLDPFGASDLRIAAMQDGFIKEMALLSTNYEKKKIEFKKYGVDISVLEEQFYRDKVAIYAKYLQKDIDAQAKERKDIIDLMQDGFEKEEAILNLEYDNKLRTTKNKNLLDIWYYTKYSELTNKYLKQNLDKDQEEFDNFQKLEKDKFSLTEHTSGERKKFELQQEREKYVKLLEFAKKYNTLFSQSQIESFEKMIKEIDNAMKNIKGDGKMDIWNMLGIDLSDEKKQLIADAFRQSTQFITDYFNKQKEIADELLSLRQKETDQTLTKLQIEREAQAAGYHNNVAQAEKDYKLAQKKQNDAIALQKKAQREQIAINAALQASNMVTGTAKIWSTFASQPYIAIPLIAIMWGSFIASQAKALSLTKKYKKGGYELIQGGSHWNNNDTYIGSNNKTDNYAESGEGMAVFNRGAVSKYGKMIPDLVEMLNTGKYTIPEKRQRQSQVQMQNVIVKNEKPNMFMIPVGEKMALIDEKGIVKKYITLAN